MVQQEIRRVQLDIPVHGLSLSVCDVDVDLHVGPAPLHQRDSSVHQRGFVHIELRRKRVMCNQRYGHPNHPDNQKQTR